MDLAPIPAADRDTLLAFLETHLLGGEPAGDPDEELAGVSDAGLAALNEQIAAFLGAETSETPASSRTGLLDRLAQLLDSVGLLNEHQTSRGEITIAPSRPDGSEPGDALRAASPRQMEMLAREKGAGRVTPATLRVMRRQAGWLSLKGFMEAHDYRNAPVVRDAAHLCRQRKLVGYESGGLSPDEAERRVQQEYMAVTHHHGKPKHKRDPYDDSPSMIHMDLSPEAAKDLEAELARHPSFQRQRRLQAGWETLHAASPRLGLSAAASRKNAAFALVCRLRKCQAYQAEGLSPAAADEQVQREYMAIHAVNGSGQARRTAIDLSPAAITDMADLTQELWLAPRKRPGWWSRQDAAHTLQYAVKTLAPLIEQLRQDKLREYEAAGATPGEADERVQAEYIAYRRSLAGRGQGATFTDLSPAAFCDLKAQTETRACWRSSTQLAQKLRAGNDTIRRYALQCRSGKIDEYVGQGLTPQEAEDRVQQQYVEVRPYGSTTAVYISPDARAAIEATLGQSPWRQRAVRHRDEKGIQRDAGR